jgi:prepilin-type N-terminal cleavage/methylation domain-containing protein
MKFFPAPHKFYTENRGFTLIELLITTTITGVLIILGVASYNSYNSRQTLLQAKNNVRAHLRLVQTRAFEGVKPGGCVSLDGWSLSFSGNSYEVRAICDGTPLSATDSFVLAEDVSYSGPSEILFLPLSRGVDTDSQLDLTFSLGSLTEEINVFPTGEIR